MSPKSKVRSPKLPFVLVNMAMTADGKIATANRAVSSFGSARDHKHLLELRATADAVMAGARTVDSAAINLGPGPARFRRLRLKNGLAEYNLRVIVSGSGSLNPDAEVFKHRFSPIIILTTGRASKAKLRQLQAVGGRSEGLRPARNQFSRGISLAAREMGRQTPALRRRRRIERRPVPGRFGGRTASDDLPENFRRAQRADHR